MTKENLSWTGWRMVPPSPESVHSAALIHSSTIEDGQFVLSLVLVLSPSDSNSNTLRDWMQTLRGSCASLQPCLSQELLDGVLSVVLYECEQHMMHPSTSVLLYQSDQHTTNSLKHRDAERPSKNIKPPGEMDISSYPSEQFSSSLRMSSSRMA